MRKVVVAQDRLVHYRVDLFERMRALAANSGIDLHVLHGQPNRIEATRNDTGRLEWADEISNRSVMVGDIEFVWQPIPTHLLDADLFVLQHQNRLLSNYPLMLRRHFAGKKTAFWGHGANLQSKNPNGWREKLKRWQVNKVDFWFAYTKITVARLENLGIPTAQIANLDNAIDTSRFENQCKSVTAAELKALRRELTIPETAPVGLYCGSLYADKRLELLLQSGDAVRREIADFHIIVIGAGPSLPMLEEAAKTRPWLHLVGIKTGSEKARYFRLSQIMLNPGALGLHILDAFCAGLPLISTRDARHGPEIAYLDNGQNGLLTENSVTDYTSALLLLLRDQSEYARLAAAARASAAIYTLDNMVANFVGGIVRCLAA